MSQVPFSLFFDLLKMMIVNHNFSQIKKFKRW